MAHRPDRSASTIFLCGLLTILCVPPAIYGWPIRGWGIFLGFFALQFLPGIVGFGFFNRTKSIGLSRSAITAVLGIAFYCFIWAVLRSLKFDHRISTIGASAASNLLVLGFLYTYRSDLDLLWSKRDVAVLVAVCICAMLLMRGPFTHFRSNEGDAIGFPYLTVTDFFTHLGIAGEVAKAIPPQNPYFAGELLHYYWLSHVFPGSFSVVAPGVTELATILQMTCLVFALLWLTLLASVLRVFVQDFVAWALTLVMSIACYTYIWVVPAAEWLLRQIAKLMPTDPFSRILVERGERYSGLSHGPIRDFVSEPHGMLAFSIVLCFILLSRQPFRLEKSREAGVIFVEGVLLGICFGVESFLGVIATLWWFVYRTELYFWNNLWNNPWNNTHASYGAVVTFFAKAVPLLLGIILVHSFCYIVQMQGSSSSNLLVYPYYRMLLLFPMVLFVEFGPIFILGVFGCRGLLDRLKNRNLASIISLIAITLVVMFTLRHTFVYNLVFRKSLRLVRLPFLSVPRL